MFLPSTIEKKERMKLEPTWDAVTEKRNRWFKIKKPKPYYMKRRMI